jgi:PEGA domain
MLRKISVALWPLVLLVVAATLWPSPVNAQMRRGRVFVVGRYAYSPFLYDPFWGPYPYYGAYVVGASPVGDVRVLATPKQAQVYVDGFYAGIVDDFDGALQRLRTTPGGHAITLHLEGYRTITENIYVTPGSTFKLQLTMDKLAPGEPSEPPPAPARSLGR